MFGFFKKKKQDTSGTPKTSFRRGYKQFWQYLGSSSPFREVLWMRWLRPF